MASDDVDLPVSPAGRLFLHPNFNQILNCTIGLKNPIDIDAIKIEIKNTLLKRHPRFTSILVYDKKGREHWRKVEKVDVDKHVFVVPEEKEDESSGEEFVNDYVAGLSVSTPMDAGKPLWEVHVMPSNRCCVLRVHHSLGDGVSLMSLFLNCCKRVDNPLLPPTFPTGRRSDNGGTRRPSVMVRVWRVVKVVWFTLVYVMDFVLRSLWVTDKKSPISGGEGVELWPRKLATVTFQLSDLKVVKNTINGTINDVLLGIISMGFKKYIDLRSPSYLENGLRITGLAMVNTRKLHGLMELSTMMKDDSEARWGNQFGFILLPVYLEKKGIEDPLDHVTRAKKTIDRKKLSLEANFCYRSGEAIMKVFGKDVSTMINYRLVARTSFTISNILGTTDELMFAGNPITYIRATITALPQAIGMHMVSYMDRADMQILVAKDIVPDVHVLVRCFEESLSDMKAAAIAK